MSMMKAFYGLIDAPCSHCATVPVIGHYAIVGPATSPKTLNEMLRHALGDLCVVGPYVCVLVAVSCRNSNCTQDAEERHPLEKLAHQAD